VDGRVHKMVDDGCHSEDTSQNADHVYKQTVPLVVRENVEDSHGVGFVSTLMEWYLKKTMGSWAKMTSFSLAV